MRDTEMETEETALERRRRLARESTQSLNSLEVGLIILTKPRGHAFSKFTFWKLSCYSIVSSVVPNLPFLGALPFSQGLDFFVGRFCKYWCMVSADLLVALPLQYLDTLGTAFSVLWCLEIL